MHFIIISVLIFNLQNLQADELRQALAALEIEKPTDLHLAQVNQEKVCIKLVVG